MCGTFLECECALDIPTLMCGISAHLAAQFIWQVLLRVCCLGGVQVSVLNTPAVEEMTERLQENAVNGTARPVTPHKIATIQVSTENAG